MAKLKDMHRQVENVPLGYFITVRTYGKWLHGDERGSVDREHRDFGSPRLEANPAKKRSEEERLKHPPTVLGAEGAEVVERKIHEVCTKRGWRVFEAKVRTNHLHAVVWAPVTAERVMNDLKAWGTRRLREAGLAGEEQEVWAAHGSTPHLYTEEQLWGAIEYVRNWQGEDL